MASTARRLSLRCTAEGSLERHAATRPRLGQDHAAAAAPSHDHRRCAKRACCALAALEAAGVEFSSGASRARPSSCSTPAGTAPSAEPVDDDDDEADSVASGVRRRRWRRLRGVGPVARPPTSARARSARCARGGRRRLAPFRTSPRIPGRRPVSTRRLVVFRGCVPVMVIPRGRGAVFYTPNTLCPDKHAIAATVVLTQGPSPRCDALARGPPARSRSTVLCGVRFSTSSVIARLFPPRRCSVERILGVRARRVRGGRQGRRRRHRPRPRNAGEGAPWRRCVVEPRGLGQWLQAADEAGVAVRVRLRGGARNTSSSGSGSRSRGRLACIAPASCRFRGVVPGRSSGAHGRPLPHQYAATRTYAQGRSGTYGAGGVPAAPEVWSSVEISRAGGYEDRFPQRCGRHPTTSPARTATSAPSASWAVVRGDADVALVCRLVAASSGRSSARGQRRAEGGGPRRDALPRRAASRRRRRRRRTRGLAQSSAAPTRRDRRRGGEAAGEGGGFLDVERAVERVFASSSAASAEEGWFEF